MAFKFCLKDSELTSEGKRYLAEIQKMSESVVRVGFQDGRNNYEDGTSLVEVAAFNEFGNSETPARPFMKQSFDRHGDELKAICSAMMKQIEKGQTAEYALKNIGVAAKGIVQNEIVDGNFVPNKPSTISRKKSSKPLIDTGHMRQSVDYVIEKGE